MEVKVEEMRGRYDENNLAFCGCSKHRYPSKRMFAEFLKGIKADGDPRAEIWSKRSLDTGETTIYVELTYKAENPSKEVIR